MFQDHHMDPETVYNKRQNVKNFMVASMIVEQEDNKKNHQ